MVRTRVRYGHVTSLGTLIAILLSTHAGAFAERPLCAPIPFENLSGRPESAYVANVIHQSLYPSLARTQNWRLVERARLEELLTESDLKASGAGGRQVRIAGADVLILGEYRDEEGVITVSARLVDAETGEVIRQAHWTGHVSGLCDAMPPRVAAALAGRPQPVEELTPKMVARFGQACRHLELERVDQAIKTCDVILETHRRDVPTLLLRGCACLRKKGWTRYAIKDFEKALKLDDGNVAARIGLARAKLTGDRRASRQAIPWLREVLDAHPEHGEALWMLARAMETAGRIDEATEAALEAVKALPEFAPAWQTLAHLHRVRGRLGKALAAAARATTCDPGDPAGWMLLGDVQAVADGGTGARASFERALACKPPPEIKKKLEARLRKYD